MVPKPSRVVPSGGPGGTTRQATGAASDRLLGTIVSQAFAAAAATNWRLVTVDLRFVVLFFMFEFPFTRHFASRRLRHPGSPLSPLPSGGICDDCNLYSALGKPKHVPGLILRNRLRRTTGGFVQSYRICWSGIVTTGSASRSASGSSKTDGAPLIVARSLSAVTA